jgi:outer membrane protein assembly factor BamB
MAVSPDSKLLATGGDDRIIRIWDMKTAKEVRKIEGATATINFLEFLPDGKSVISASWHSSDRVVTIWDVTSGKERRRIRMGASRLWWLRMSSDGRTMACVYFDALSDLTLHFLDPNTHKDIRKVSGGESYACNFALSPDGKKYIFQSMSERRGVGTMVIGDVAEDKDTTTLLHGILGIPVFAPDSLNVAVMGNDGIIHVLDTVTGNEIRQFGEKSETEVDGRPGTRMLGRPFEPGQTTLAYSADGRMLASLGKEGLLLWEVATGKQRRAFAGGHHGALSCLTFTPDGTTLLSSSQEGQVFFWDLAGMSKDEKDAAEKLTSKDAEKLWNDLQAEDAARAYRAIRLLSAAPGVSLPLFEEKLKPAAGADQKRIDKLIADLDAEEFDVRARAVQELEKLDELAVTSLRKALEGKTSVEAGKRIEEMLQKIGRKSFINGEKLRTWRALEVLEHMNGEAATSLLKRLASGAEGAWLTREAKASLERSKAARNQ